jgi:hypothetical protein
MTASVHLADSADGIGFETQVVDTERVDMKTRNWVIQTRLCPTAGRLSEVARTLKQT